MANEENIPQPSKQHSHISSDPKKSASPIDLEFPSDRLKRLEDEIAHLKIILATLSQEVEELKKAQ